MLKLTIQYKTSMNYFLILSNNKNTALIRRGESLSGVCSNDEYAVICTVYTQSLELVSKIPIKNIFIMIQRGTNIMANQVKTPIKNYFEKLLYENLTFEILE
jgi:hypothetical protein